MGIDCMQRITDDILEVVDIRDFMNAEQEGCWDEMTDAEQEGLLGEVSFHLARCILLGALDGPLAEAVRCAFGGHMVAEEA